MLNTSTSLVSEMIGQDDHASAVVFASLNIVESFSNGGVVFVIMSYSLNDDPEWLKFVIGVLPFLSCMGAYIISYFRFKNITQQFYASGQAPPPKKKFHH